MTKTVLVTGANRGVGLSITKLLAESGYLVFLGSRDIKAGKDAAESFCRSGLDVLPVHLDLSDSGIIDSAVKEIADSGFKPDVLINNAGVLHQKPLLEMTDEEITESFAVHLTGPIRLIRALAPEMIKNRYGRIVNITSDWGSFAEGMGGPGTYGVTKAGLNALTMRLSKEFPYFVKINSMCPGWVRTRMGGAAASRSPDEAADTAVWLATLPENGPTGGFFRDRKPMPW